MSTSPTLIAVFDGAQARFFEADRDGRLSAVLPEMNAHLAHDRRDIETAPPGRGGAASAGQRHAYESEHDPRKLEKHDFIRAIAGAIEEALDLHAFTDLVVVAPERSLGEFRNLASGKVKATIRREVPKELANLSDSELANHLQPVLQEL